MKYVKRKAHIKTDDKIVEKLNQRGDTDVGYGAGVNNDSADEVSKKILTFPKLSLFPALYRFGSITTVAVESNIQARRQHCNYGYRFCTNGSNSHCR